MGYKRLASHHSTWASKFQLLEAEAMVWRGMYENALGILSSASLAISDPADKIERLTLEAVAYTRLHQFATADNKLRASRKTLFSRGLSGMWWGHKGARKPGTGAWRLCKSA